MKFINQIEETLGIGAYIATIFFFVVEFFTEHNINFALKIVTALAGITYVCFKTRHEIVETKKLKKEIEKLEKETK